MSTPQSTIHVCKGVRLNNSYEHTIYFDSAETQLQYFAGKVDRTFSAYTYLRKSWNIKLQASYEQARKWSYLYFQNGSGKIYYYFIVQVEYVSDTTVELHLDLDVMQTYFFDYTLQRCFVEREHVAVDNIGSHTVEEGLDVGELKMIDSSIVSLSSYCVLVLATFNPLTTTKESTDTILYAKYNNVFSGLGIYAVEPVDYTAWGTKLKQLDEWGKSDGIISMWMYPKSLVGLAEGSAWGDGHVTKEVSEITPFFHDTKRNDKLSGNYAPRNNKLYCYPYNFLYVTNNSGGAAVYRYERFGDTSFCNFKVTGALSPEGVVKMHPLNYNGMQHCYDEGLVLNGFPSCAWNQDVYKLWLAQNQHQQNLSMGVSLMKIGVGGVMALATGGMSALAGGGSIISGAREIASLLAQRNDKELQPPQAKGQHSANVNIVNGEQTFVLMRKSVSSEFAKIIDDYFDMFGYKVSCLKIPNRKNRQNWTYIKTIGCFITGSFCNEDQTKIQNIYNKGITFWVNGDSIGNYSLDNKTL